MKDIVKIVDTCEVCKSTHLREILNLGEQPLCDDLIEIGSSNVNHRYPIVVLYCDNCNTAHQKFQISREVLFPSNYHYRAGLTKDVLSGMRDFVSECEIRVGSLKGKKVIDIGCNDGSLLGYFKQKGAITIGVEPTDAINDSDNRIDFMINDYFNINTASNIFEEHGYPDIISFTNVFAHIDDLHSLMKAVKRIVGKKTILVIENHYLGSVIEGMQFDTFYHEHPRTYSIQSFIHISSSLGLTLNDVQLPKRYGGNIRVFMSNQGVLNTKKGNVLAALDKENNILKNIDNMANYIVSWKEDTIKKISDLNDSNLKIAAKAFPARASIIINYLGLDENDISAVIEQPNSKKVGLKVPGTNIPIVGSSDFDQYDVLINLAWHINDEIKNYLEEASFNGDLFAILPKFKKIN